MHHSDEKPRVAALSPNAESGQPAKHTTERYQGKRLFYLVLAICVPAALLYLRLVCGIAATDSRVSPGQSLWLERLSIGALMLFFVGQLTCARYLQRLLQPRQTAVGNTLQYLGVLTFCTLLSLTGAIILEAFGFNVFLRAAAGR
jgi:hypothetical protein